MSRPLSVQEIKASVENEDTGPRVEGGVSGTRFETGVHGWRGLGNLVIVILDPGLKEISGGSLRLYVSPRVLVGWKFFSLDLVLFYVILT